MLMSSTGNGTARFHGQRGVIRAPDVVPHIMSILGQTKATKERQLAKAQRRRNAMKKAMMASNACMCLGSENKIRGWCVWISSSPGFDKFILVLIFLSMVVSAMDHPDVKFILSWKNAPDRGQHTDRACTQEC